MLGLFGDDPNELVIGDCDLAYIGGNGDRGDNQSVGGWQRGENDHAELGVWDGRTH